MRDPRPVRTLVLLQGLALLLGARTAPWFLLAWGAGAGAGALAGFVQFRVHPLRRGTGPMLSHTWPFSRWLRGRSARNSQRRSLFCRFSPGASSWARVQKMARSAGGLKPSGSNMAPWSWLPRITTWHFITRSTHSRGLGP